MKPPFTPAPAKRRSPMILRRGDRSTRLVRPSQTALRRHRIQLPAPFVGVELDGCRDPETGVINDGAQAIIDDLDSYTEISPSGRGVHILVKEELRLGGTRTVGVECMTTTTSASQGSTSLARR